MITIDMTVNLTGGLTTTEVGDELMVLRLESGEYFGLNEVGAVIWEAVQSPTSVSEVRDHVREHFDVDVATCESDVLRVLNELHAAGLIEVVEVPG